MEKWYYNGFTVKRPDGTTFDYTIQHRYFNRRPYALYCNGIQTGFNTYINRGSLVNLVKRLAIEIKYQNPTFIISDICGAEIIR